LKINLALRIKTIIIYLESSCLDLLKLKTLAMVGRSYR
jgi:hypothetical protein